LFHPFKKGIESIDEDNSRYKKLGVQKKEKREKENKKERNQYKNWFLKCEDQS